MRIFAILIALVAMPATAETVDPQRNAIVGAQVFAACVQSVLAGSGATPQAIVASIQGADALNDIEFRHGPERCQISIPIDRVDVSAFHGQWERLRVHQLNLPAGDCQSLDVASPPGTVFYCDLPAIVMPDGRSVRFRIAQAAFSNDIADLLMVEAPAQ